jgi:hypothetical protein
VSLCACVCSCWCLCLWGSGGVVVVVVGGRLPDDYNFAVRTGTRTSAGAFAIEFIVRNI